ncbi:hypothetical protein MNBD_GAMMA22-1503 [hydrothermal vent metagenome]|uniref:Carboxypeptidase regulatory-like domain-containing protein n=1 Tax=hydrothermal vent metagenome TaxID=652676 RepID=A0A3B1AHI0_9ZZZZ
MKKYKNSQLILLSFILLLLNACASGEPLMSWPEMNGQVVDTDTGEPIADAFVIARWQGRVGFFHGSSTCYHVESTMSDAQGNFTIPSWFEWFDNFWTHMKSVSISTYKSDYVTVFNRLSNEEKKNIQYQRKSNGTREDKLGYIKLTARRNFCSNAGQSRRKSYYLYRRLYEDAKKITLTKDEKKNLEWFRDIAVSAWVATDQNRTREEKEKLVLEHLRDNLK